MNPMTSLFNYIFSYFLIIFQYLKTQQEKREKQRQDKIAFEEEYENYLNDCAGVSDEEEEY